MKAMRIILLIITFVVSTTLYAIELSEKQHNFHVTDIHCHEHLYLRNHEHIHMHSSATHTHAHQHADSVQMMLYAFINSNHQYDTFERASNLYLFEEVAPTNPILDNLFRPPIS